MSELRACCRVLSQHSSTQREIVKTPDDEAALAADITALVLQYSRYGYRRISAMLHLAGGVVNALPYVAVGLAEVALLGNNLSATSLPRLGDEGKRDCWLAARNNLADPKIGIARILYLVESGFSQTRSQSSASIMYLLPTTPVPLL